MKHHASDHPEGEGDHLAHYTRADIAFEHILIPGGRLKMNPYGAMRDPLENQDPFVYPRYLDAGEDEFNMRLLAVHRALATTRDNVRLLSLTQRAAWSRSERKAEMYSEPWARPRMWEQYADNHAGVCLVFSKQRLLKILEGIEDGTVLHQAVQYRAGGYAGSAAPQDFDLAGYTDDNAEARIAFFVAQHLDDFFFLKTSDWEAEHEYRILLFSKSKTAEPYFVPFEEALNYVVLGEKFPAWQIDGVKSAIRHLPDYVQLRKMSWHRGHAMSLNLR